MYSVKPADKQPIFVVCFYAVRVPQFMQTDVSLLHVRCNPRALLALSFSGSTSVDNFGKSSVICHVKIGVSYQLAHTLSYLKFFRIEYKTFMWSIPQDRCFIRKPRKDSMLVRQ